MLFSTHQEILHPMVTTVSSCGLYNTLETNPLLLWRVGFQYCISSQPAGYSSGDALISLPLLTVRFLKSKSMAILLSIGKQWHTILGWIWIKIRTEITDEILYFTALVWNHVSKSTHCSIRPNLGGGQEEGCSASQNAKVFRIVIRTRHDHPNLCYISSTFFHSYNVWVLSTFNCNLCW